MNRKVINRMVYDTNTATAVASWDNDLPDSDFKACSETIYRTANGRWFLHGQGGAASRWAKGEGGRSWASEDIIALTDDEALEWLAAHDKTEAAVKYFRTIVTDA
jgi:hypothetical protein